MVNVIFTGVYRYNTKITNLSLNERISRIKNNGVDNIYWCTWKGHTVKEVENAGVKIIEIEEPYPHVRGVSGRQRQIYNIKQALQFFNPDDIILKLRWDLDFTENLITNLSSPDFLDKVENGVVKNKIWTGFYSIQELFSPADKTFAGYQKDLNKIINFQFKINNESSDKYISHDGMMLMPYFVNLNKSICSLIRKSEPEPYGLFYNKHHNEIEKFLEAWAFSYYLLDKYFKTGPLGTCFFKRGDLDRWPMSIVDYNKFQYNYDTMTGKAPKLGIYPRYRVYDDIFVQKLVNGEFRDHFAQSLHSIITEKKKVWQEMGV